MSLDQMRDPIVSKRYSLHATKAVVNQTKSVRNGTKVIAKQKYKCLTANISLN